ncbi:hypothetical protein GH714_039220 [Hevea brasiliensis]|uniref:non-specific serine/threonine protein kinase n=1 Tax=Hevea brasiliensis TaxID=3981 RepID=A0A6A6KPH1_HEVBR|nr:hypothetical protein GH714_039220 [Hevea brasiliensis]
MGPISAAFGDNGFFCAIDASGKQDVTCWTKNTTLPSPSFSSLATSSGYLSSIPAMSSLSGGEGFLCGILANSSQALCWSSIYLGRDLVPSIYSNTAYSHIAAGKDHVCAIRGSYFSDHESGTIDCWDIVKGANNSLTSTQSSQFYDQSISNLVFSKVVSGEGYSCGRVREGGAVCWGPNSASLGVSSVLDNYRVLASGMRSLCGILEESNEGGAGFTAIASSDFTTCGIREDDLVIDCWFASGTSPPEYNPPLELFSPGLCGPGSCGEGEFVFNASFLNEPDLTSLCFRKDLNICSPCGSNCSQGFFLSSPCTENADRVCTACSLCQNSSCWGVCGMQSSAQKQWHHLRRLVIIIGPSALGFLLILISCCVFSRSMVTRKEEGSKKQFKSCIGKPKLENNNASDSHQLTSTTSCPGMAQVFRLSELKDATNRFKEFNKLGRGRYGLVYKAVLTDGRQVAVKRANAATIIHTNSRDFEMELEVLCNVRHCNIVNLLGYCSEMGERLLVYEYMPHGTLHDHLHGELSPLNWSFRLKIAMQAAKGLEYLHKEAKPPIVHRNVKTSNILLDSEWGARIADFGLLTANEKDLGGDMKTDVYNFGIILLEILSGRKAYDKDSTPPSIVDWAIPLIKQGKAAAIIDRYVALPRNFEPLLKLADIAELAVRENPNSRPTMSDLATWLEQIVKDGLTL